MTKLSTLIEQNKQKFARHEFLTFLTDKTIPLSQRLSFLPNIAHFVMSFSDINKFILPFQNPSNDLEHAVNQHAQEDANHWPWFLNDLQSTGLNKQGSLTDNLEFLWSENIKNSRLLTYQLIRLLTDKPAKIRLVVIEIMEATGNVTFDTLSQITKDSAFPLEFCGNIHFSHETGHSIGSEEELIDTIEYSNQEMNDATNAISDGFQAFERFFDELMMNMKARSSEGQV
ncbi:hypothetical protein [Pragia fontium]|uniref:Uncharacterized protein n=1 Tax=Pragia fontium DSM 5563 = ATCC 49100 TaxID=1122977 RepID=A0AAJ5BFY5_9GAMM|nr:hypothetical protein [Pragia fontium]SFC09863.1 hypothetical protein SAMN02745723_101381 [Pragia fontium DSM 5563 = ATCC 49100]